MKRLGLLLFGILLFVPIVFGIETRQECLNSTHINVITEWIECDGTSCVSYNISQGNFTCAYGCDETYDKCMYVSENETGNVIAFVGVTFIIVMFFILGSKADTGGEEFNTFKRGWQTLFFIVGLWMLILDIALVETIATASGVSLNTLNLIVETIEILTWVLYVVIALMFFSYLFAVIMLMVPGKKR